MLAFAPSLCSTEDDPWNNHTPTPSTPIATEAMNTSSAYGKEPHSDESDLFRYSSDNPIDGRPTPILPNKTLPPQESTMNHLNGDSSPPHTSEHERLSGNSAAHDGEEEEEAFVYMPSSPDPPQDKSSEQHEIDAHDSGEETFTYAADPFASQEQTIDAGLQSTQTPERQDGSTRNIQSSSSVTPEPEPIASTPPPIDYSQLHQLCLSASLESLQQFFAHTIQISQVSSFVLANEPNPTSGLMPIHYAAKEGKMEILKWLVQDVGALIEIEDREGEVSGACRDDR